MKLHCFHARIGISIMEPSDWWLTIYADSQDKAVIYIKRSTQRDFIVTEVDDLYDNELSNLLTEILDVPIGQLLLKKQAEIKEFYELEGYSLILEDNDVVGYEKNKGVIAAGLRLFGKYLLNPNPGESNKMASYGIWKRS